MVPARPRVISDGRSSLVLHGVLISAVACSSRRVVLCRPVPRVPVTPAPLRHLLRKWSPRTHRPIRLHEALCRKLGAVLHCRGTSGRDATKHHDREAGACHRGRSRIPRIPHHFPADESRPSTDRRTKLVPCTRHTFAPADELSPNRCSHDSMHGVHFEPSTTLPLYCLELRIPTLRAGRLGCRGRVTPNIDTPSGQTSSKAGVLALLADSQ